MILPRSLVGPFALMVALVSCTVVIAAGIAQAPESFSGGDRVILLGPSGSLPGQSTIPRNLADALRALPSVTHVSDEVYAPTVIAGRSGFVRGVVPAEFFAVEGATLTQGRLPVTPTEFLVGEGLARVAHLGPGDSLLIPGSLSRTAMAGVIVGVFETRGPARDEVVVALDVAQQLSGLSPAQIHLARALADDGDNVRRVLASENANFSYSGVKISSDSVFAGEPVRLTAQLTNWGRLAGTKTVVVRSGGTVLAQEYVLVAPRSTVPIDIVFALPSAGAQTVTINPSFNVTVREPKLQFVGHGATATRGEPFPFRVTDRVGAGVAGVTVTAGDTSTQTDESGGGRIVASWPGPRMRLTASLDGVIEGAMEVELVGASHVEGPHPRLVGIKRPGPELGPQTPVVAELLFTNDGTEASVFAYVLHMDGAPVLNASVTLPAGAAITQTHELGTLDAGDHTISVPEQGMTIPVRVYEGPDPAVEAYADRISRGVIPRPLPPVDDTEEAVRALVGDITLVVTLLVAGSSILVSVGLFFVISRALGEAQLRIGILRALGATKERVVALIEREMAIIMAGAALVGGAAGVIVAFLIAASGDARAFGHALRVAPTLWILVVLYLGAIVVTVGITRATASYLLDAPIDDLMRGTTFHPPRSPPRDMAVVLRGRP